MKEARAMNAQFLSSTLIFWGVFLSLTLSLPSSAEILDRPKVGLVLAGGGARGAAHIGVLKYL